MIESWRFINGEKITFPTSSMEADVLGWHGIRHQYWAFIDDGIKVESWLKENVLDRAYYFGVHYVYFYRESDAAFFRLKWS